MSDDSREILNAMAAYSYAVDNSDWTILERAYYAGTKHINATGDVVTGIDEFISYRKAKEPDELRELLHVPANVLLDIDGDRAASTANFMYLGRADPDAEWKILSLGAYKDEFVRLDIGWRFAVREIVSFRRVDARTWAAFPGSEDKPIQTGVQP
jgi:SnoaL-like domain